MSIRDEVNAKFDALELGLVALDWSVQHRYDTGHDDTQMKAAGSEVTSTSTLIRCTVCGTTATITTNGALDGLDR